MHAAVSPWLSTFPIVVLCFKAVTRARNHLATTTTSTDIQHLANTQPCPSSANSAVTRAKTQPHHRLGTIATSPPPLPPATTSPPQPPPLKNPACHFSTFPPNSATKSTTSSPPPPSSSFPPPPLLTTKKTALQPPSPAFSSPPAKPAANIFPSCTPLPPSRWKSVTSTSCPFSTPSRTFTPPNSKRSA